MRLRVVALVAAVASMVALAFVVPLALVVRDLAAERAIRPAEVATRSLAAVAALADQEEVDAVSAALDPGGELGLGLQRPDGSAEGPRLDPSVATAIAERAEAGRFNVEDGIVVAVPVVGADGTTVVHAAVREGELRAGVLTAWWTLGLLGVVLLVGSLAVADRLARRTIDAVRELDELARRLGSGELHARAGRLEPRELDDVAGTLAVLADRIEDLLQDEREHAADLSHRLRTPLTPLRIDVEALDDDIARRRLLEHVDRLESSVSDVIRRTRSGSTVSTELTDVTDVVQERLVFWSALADDEKRPLEVDVRGPALVDHLTEGALIDLVDVLVDNAFTHTPAGTMLRVTARTTSSTVEIVVLDDGPGMKTGMIDRGSTTRTTSTGLGLDIAHRIVRQARGKIVLSPGHDGRGLRVVITLPLAPGQT